MCSATACAWFSIFLENAFVSRVKRRMFIRIVRLLRSANDVLICSGSGSPTEQFIKLQRDFDLAQARIVAQPDPGRTTRAYLYGDLPVAEMIKRGWIDADRTSSSARRQRRALSQTAARRLGPSPVLDRL